LNVLLKLGSHVPVTPIKKISFSLLLCVLGGVMTTVGWAQNYPTQNYPNRPANQGYYPPVYSQPGYGQQAPNNYPPNVYPQNSYPPASPYPPQINVPAQQGSLQSPMQGTGGRVLQTGASQLDGPENILIILDASYSMKERLPSGETKIAAAKRVILEVLRKIPPEKRVGLRVYGHSANPFSSCRDSKLLVPIGGNNRTLIGSSLLGIRPNGNTPITYAIKTAMLNDFNTVTSGKKTIILVSDGMETCDADPCDTAVEMLRRGFDVKIDVVGFGLADFNANRQLKCVALSTFGKFYSANTAAELGRSLENSMDAQTTVQGQIVPKIK
jgi:hypothetical protein